MAGIAKKSLNNGSRQQSRRGIEEPAAVKWTLIGLALLFGAIFLVLPLANVFAQALAKGWEYYIRSFSDRYTLSSIKLTLLVAAITVPLNVIFGLAAAWAVAKFNFRGKSILVTMIDLPFSVSPVVVGLMLMIWFGGQGLLNSIVLDQETGTTVLSWMIDHNLKVVFAVPGIVLATVFVTFPFVARELIPVMQATGTEQEQAALTLGANGWQTFWYVTLPSVKWGLIYGIILCNARAMGEFGAVAVVSGDIAGETQTMPLRVQGLYEGGTATTAAAFALASLLALLALITLALKTLLEWKQSREFRRAQQLALPDAESDTAFLARQKTR